MANLVGTPPATLIYCDLKSKAGVLVKESLLLQEWLSLHYPGADIQPRLRLGPILALGGTQVSPTLMQNVNAYADAVVLSPNEQLVIEAKLWPSVSQYACAVGQALVYTTLVYSTAELTATLGIVWQPTVLFAMDVPPVTAIARRSGVRVEIYTPTWFASQVLGH